MLWERATQHYPDQVLVSNLARRAIAYVNMVRVLGQCKVLILSLTCSLISPQVKVGQILVEEIGMVLRSFCTCPGEVTTAWLRRKQQAQRKLGGSGGHLEARIDDRLRMMCVSGAMGRSTMTFSSLLGRTRWMLVPLTERGNAGEGTGIWRSGKSRVVLGHVEYEGLLQYFSSFWWNLKLIYSTVENL